MVKLIDIDSILELIQTHSLRSYLTDIMNALKEDFASWEKFDLIPRPAFHSKDGVIELMPTATSEYFTYKCVNGHPNNPKSGKQTVVATGQLNSMIDGYPLMICEMTIITAIRTAAISALASDLLAKSEAKTLAIIGTGAQSEFQVIAHRIIRNIENIHYFDIDQQAMDKFKNNINSNFSGEKINLIPFNNAKDTIKDADIIIVCTADKQNAIILENSWLEKGQHISALGGDCPGKTELDYNILLNSVVVVEYLKQALIEGEIQSLSEKQLSQANIIELHEIINKTKSGRKSNDDITIFDGIGIAVDDYSAIRITYDLCKKYGIGKNINMLPKNTDPKNLFKEIIR